MTNTQKDESALIDEAQDAAFDAAWNAIHDVLKTDRTVIGDTDAVEYFCDCLRDFIVEVRANG